MPAASAAAIYLTPIITMALLLITSLITHAAAFEQCDCVCNSVDSDICEALSQIKTELNAVIKTVGKRTYIVNEVDRMRDMVDHHKEVIRKLSREIEELKSASNRNDSQPTAEFLIKIPDGMQGDAPSEDELKESDGHKEVDDLLMKMEKMENLTMEVQEELESERRVRRHLEEDLNETRFSVKLLGDRLENVTIPMDTRVTHVEEVVFSTFENINKTLFEDHLQKLYYKIDGVVYKNETRRLDQRLDYVESELNDVSNSSAVSGLAAELGTLSKTLTQLNSTIKDNLALRLEFLESNTASKEQLQELVNRTAHLSYATQILTVDLVDIHNNIQDMQNFQANIQNISDELKQSLDQLGTKVEILEAMKTKNESESHLIQNPATEFEIFDYKEPNRTEVPNEASKETSQLLRFLGDSEDSLCKLPVIDDPHLLVRMEEEQNGEQSLVFGCRPIGRYVLVDTPVPVQCTNGVWNGPFPTCIRLLDEDEIESFAANLETANPCLTGSGVYPDPTNCSRFFNCSHRNRFVMNCPPNLHFNAQVGVCDYPRSARCTPQTGPTRALEDFIPPILVEPDNIDKPYGHMGTGSAGELIIHPGTTFTLRCLFPADMWGVPVWNVKYLNSDFEARISPTDIGDNYVAITLLAAREGASGSYTCRTPFGQEHTIKVLVTVIRCPAILTPGETHNVYYRPTPEGGYRILGTTAEFDCGHGRWITATCLGNGTWSRGPPTPEECTPKKKVARLGWKCPPLITENHPDLILEDDEEEQIVTFKCAGQLELIGNSFTRCRDDGQWSHRSLPRCIN